MLIVNCVISSIDCGFFLCVCVCLFGIGDFYSFFNSDRKFPKKINNQLSQ